MLEAVVVLAAVAVCGIFFFVLGTRRYFSAKIFSAKTDLSFVPVSVNFHYTRQCNYACGFCFHTAKTSHLTPLAEAKRGLKMLQEFGMRKLNLSGGEPFLHAKYAGEICRFCKEVLKLESVSIVSNGSKIKENFFEKYGKFVDILAVSVDSFDQQTNIDIGRDEKGKGEHLQHLENVADWCRQYDIRFKLNTVVNRHNCEEDMNAEIGRLQPFRWKAFQVLAVDTENSGSGTRDVTSFLITDAQFEDFCKRHSGQKCLVPESNSMMKSSYLILDEYMRFLNKGDAYGEGPSILDVGVPKALEGVDFEDDVFKMRGGVYDWFGQKSPCCAVAQDKSLQW